MASSAGYMSALDRFRRRNVGDATRRSSRAQFDTFREAYTEDARNLRASQVGLGRLDTGFAQEDEEILERQFTDRLGRQLALNALREEGLQQQSDTTLLEGEAGQRDYLTAEENRKRKKRGGILGGILGIGGGVGGFLLGGPAGAAAGFNAGRYVGESFGG